MILKDDELDTPNPKAATVSTLVNTSADFAFKLSKLIDPFNHKAWYDVKAGCYIDKELPLGLKPK